MRFLLGTNVISEWVKPRPDPGVIAWLDSADEDSLYLSVLAFAEIRLGIVRLSAGRRRRRLGDWLDRDLTDRFEGRILPIDRWVAETWALLVASGRKRGVVPPIMDAFIAATALVHGMTLVSRNVRHLQGFEVPVVNPWRAA